MLRKAEGFRAERRFRNRMKLKFLDTFLALFCLAATLLFAADTGEDQLLDAYTAVSVALADDNLDAAQKAAVELAAAAGNDQPELAQEAEAVGESDSLETARKKFKPLSEDAVKLSEGKEGYFVMTCPMVAGDWVQKYKQVANPNYGESMLRCGGLKKQ